MRCPSCQDEYEDGIRTCAGCQVPLVPDDAVPVPPVPADARLGTFHPVMAERVGELLYRRGLDYRSIARDDAVEVRVDQEWRDDLRAELSLTWGELVRRLDAEVVEQILADGGDAPGWYDPPQGGYVDREGRLVVDVDDEDQATDAARVIGPALFTVGAIMTVMGWYLADSPALTVAGIALVLFGLFNPR